MFFSWAYTNSGMVGSYGNLMFSFLRNCQTVSQSGCSILHSHQQSSRALISQDPHHYLLLKMCLFDSIHPSTKQSSLYSVFFFFFFINLFYLLGWPKNSFRFFCKMLRENPNGLFCQPNIYLATVWDTEDLSSLTRGLHLLLLQ